MTHHTKASQTECDVVPITTYNSILLDLNTTQNELEKVSEEYRELKSKLIELQASLDHEILIHMEVEENARHLIQSPSGKIELANKQSLVDQIEMLSDKAKALEQINELQSGVLDKQFIINQRDEITNLRETISNRNHAADESFSQISATSEKLDLESLDDMDINHVTLDEANSTIGSIVSTEGSDKNDEKVPKQPRYKKRKFRRGHIMVVNNSNFSDSSNTESDILDPAAIHSKDVDRMNEFSKIISRLLSMPESVDTVLIGDSNLHAIRGKKLDATNGTWVFSSGGLCLVSAVHALKKHGRSYPNVKRIVYHIGLNDELHKTQHVSGERPKYLRALKELTHEIFPNAEIKYILPFIGGKMDRGSIMRLKEDIAHSIPECDIYHPPNMKEKLITGVHLKPSGVASFMSFLRSYIIPNRQVIFRSDSGKSSYFESTSYSSSVRNIKGPVQCATVHAPSMVSAIPRVDKNLVESITELVIAALIENNLVHNAQ